MTQSFPQPTNIHPAARLAVSGLGASCADRTGGDHRSAGMDVPGSYGIDAGGEKDRRGYTFGGGGLRAGAR